MKTIVEIFKSFVDKRKCSHLRSILVMYVIRDLPNPIGSIRHRHANIVPLTPDTGGAPLWSIDVHTVPHEPPLKFLLQERNITKSLLTSGATD